MNNSKHRDDALGQSKSFIEFQQKLSRVAKVNRSVLIIGERGSGKELAASRLHYLSPRWEAPLVTLNCSALPPSLIETELFGHEAGAFTGAKGRRIGRFEEADGGTLFLDEIGLIPLEVQEKILRVVEYGEYERVGSSRTIESDVRIIGATNADLPALVQEGRFKADLLDRLSFEVLFLPPLRHRSEDIGLLARHFGLRMAREIGMPDDFSVSERVLQTLLMYDWPGNIRELKNVIERAVYSSENGVIDELVLDPFLNPYQIEGTDEKARDNIEENTNHDGSETENQTRAPEDLSLFKENMKEIELQYLKAAMQKAQYNQKKAAELLKLTYDQFRGLYRKHGPVSE
ncbi:MAG: phage shock protein operon transcriptional activator [Spirochaetales bacterium]|nr:phage shock protein operon transcriptional activator [Spirochaetales bacterium]